MFDAQFGRQRLIVFHNITGKKAVHEKINELDVHIGGQMKINAIIFFNQLSLRDERHTVGVKNDFGERAGIRSLLRIELPIRLIESGVIFGVDVNASLNREITFARQEIDSVGIKLIIMALSKY